MAHPFISVWLAGCLPVEMAKAWIIISYWMLKVFADELRPSSGEKVIANQTYLANWLLTPGPGGVIGPIEVRIPNMTPPDYTSTFIISLRKYAHKPDQHTPVPQVKGAIPSLLTLRWGSPRKNGSNRPYHDNNRVYKFGIHRDQPDEHNDND